MAKYSISQKLEPLHSQIEIKFVQSKDEQDLFDFYASNLKTGEKFRFFWEWRKRQLPHSGGEMAIIAKADKHIVGSIGIVPAFVTLNGARIKVSWQQDSLVSPSMRGKGLGKELVNKGGRGWDLIMAKGTSKAMYSLRKSLGYSDVPKSDYLLRVVRQRSKKINMKERILEYALWIWQAVVSMPQGDLEIHVSSVKSFDESFDELAKKLSEQGVVRLYKSSGYLNWRYCQCPVRDYAIYRAGGERARGAVVLNTVGRESEEGWIVDLICAADDKKCAYRLLRKSMDYFKEKGVSRIWAFATLPASRKWLYRLGFLPTGRTPRFTYRVNGRGVDSLRVINASWDFWHGDGDIELYP